MSDTSALLAPFGRLAAQLEPAPGERMNENKVWYLKQNRLFDQAGEFGIESCEHLFVMTQHPRRTRIFDLGDPTRVVYLIKTGKVRISRMTPEGKEVTVAILGKGDMFGEETLFDAETPRTTIATCLEETLLCTAKAEDMFGLLTRNPALAMNVAKILSGRLLEATATMEDLAYAKIPERLLNLFARLAEEYGRPVEDGILVDVKLTHADIASLIGSTRETVTLELNRLIDAGSLRSHDGAYVLVGGVA